MYKARDVAEVLQTTGRLLVFRSAVPDLKRLGPLYLGLGLAFAWLVGIGRYWDNPRAGFWQHLGLGSVAYVFALALLLWLLLWPLKPRNWHYRTVLVFVALTSPPAILYAIPVERFLSLDGAQQMNVLFLATVALWRVILLCLFLRRSAGLRVFEVIVGTLLPITLIVVALAILNLEHVVFQFMGGLDPAQETANDGAYAVLFLITLLSPPALLILVIAYLVLCVLRWKSKGQAA